ncbi:hypothetical protein ppKF707_2495 [Metapseudomonas furukawaii]|uniref:Uncharacterized protein n=1 Tax=Metapseudomonas furukawaii TaxID=1149133 RepID=A0AAD1C2E4_METFU|nr:hypothetical protein ppKF707_2495 [Pseudomonas furukawaii]BAU75560.1 hypothetical protein KF707C_38720 [Pseudomonas furukawaii]
MLGTDYRTIHSHIFHGTQRPERLPAQGNFPDQKMHRPECTPS